MLLTQQHLVDLVDPAILEDLEHCQQDLEHLDLLTLEDLGDLEILIYLDC
jgi:hypothetical protein